MNCPHCSTAGAYVGFSAIECQNQNCKHYKAHDTVHIEGPAPTVELTREYTIAWNTNDLISIRDCARQLRAELKQAQREISSMLAKGE